jgi:hypothetical protein
MVMQNLNMNIKAGFGLFYFVIWLFSCYYENTFTSATIRCERAKPALRIGGRDAPDAWRVGKTCFNSDSKVPTMWPLPPEVLHV